MRYFRSKNLWSSFILVLAGVFSDAERLLSYDGLLPRFRINNEQHVLGGPCTIHLIDRHLALDVHHSKNNIALASPCSAAAV